MNKESSRHSPLTLGFIRDHPRDAARALAALEEAELAEFVDSLPASLAAALLGHLEPLKASRCLQALAPSRAAAALAPAASASAAVLLRRLPGGNREAILTAMPATAQARLRLLLSYPADTVGSVLEPDVLTFAEHVAVAEAVAGARRGRRHLMNVVYVLDAGQRLRGAVDLRDLLVSDPGGSLQALIRRGDAALPARATLAAAARHPGWIDYETLPVTDRRGVFLGVLRRSVLLSATRGAGAGADPGEGLTRSLLELSEVIWVAGAGVLWTALGAGPKKG